MQFIGLDHKEHLETFSKNGFLVLSNLFEPEDLTPLRQEIAQIIDAVAIRLEAEGRLSDLRSEEPFETRLTRLLSNHPELAGEFMKAIEGRSGGGHRGIEMFRVMTHPRLLNVLELFLGPEIVGSSVYRIRPKVPGYGRGVVPWHQDSGYFEAHCDNSLIITVWIPLVDATPENGCLQVMPGSHKQGIIRHHTGGNAGFLVIEDEDLPQQTESIVTAPVPLGGALLLTNLTLHCSTPNVTDTIRWSVDLRYQSLSAPTNAFQMPDAFSPVAEPINVACYPPEADFVVRSVTHPETVTSWDQFRERRKAYDEASIPYPNRHWVPVGQDLEG